MPMTLLDVVRTSAKKFPHRSAVTMKRGFRTLSFTYKELYDFSKKVALFLESNGIAPGERVILIAPNSPFWVAVYWGTLMRGCTIVPLTVQSTPEFVEKARVQTDTRLVFKYQLFNYQAPGVVVIDIDILDELVEPYVPAHYKSVKVSADDIAQILYTSGTTGDPKGVMLTHHNLVSNMLAIAELIHPQSGKDRLLSILPLSHILEQTIGMLLPIHKGVQVVYAHSPALIADLMKQWHITKMVAVPEFLQLIRSRVEAAVAKQGREKLFNRLMTLSYKLQWKWLSRIMFRSVLNQFGGKLDTLASGGAPLSSELEQWWNNMGIIILQGYGLTETSPVVTTNTYEERCFTSVGKVMRDIQAMIADDGEILVKGPNVFKGYYKNEEKTRESFTDDGWFKTGDMGEFDADGFLFLRGRKKYMILGAGGQNVFPEDIEDVLNSIIGVKDSAVLGIEHAHGAVSIHAALLLEPGAPDPSKIIEQANNQLASYQHIADWTVWPEVDFPRSATRKVRKEIVRAYIKDHGTSKTFSASVSPLIRLLSSVSGIGLQNIGLDTVLVRDLHLDSLKRIELLARIEQEFRVVIDEALITPQLSVQQLQQLIDKREPVKPQKPLSRWPRTRVAAVIRFILQEFLFLVSRLFLRVNVKGIKHLSQYKGVLLLMPNHLSNWDSVVVARIVPLRIRWRLSFAAALDVVYGEYRYLSWLTELSFNCFPLPRQEGTHIKMGLENTGQMLDMGYHVVVFPEGKISPDGNLLPFKDGAGLLATQMGVPIVPIRIRNIEKIFPYDTLIPRSWGTVQVSVGKPITFSRRDNYQEATQRIRHAFDEL